MSSISRALEALQALQAPLDACKRIAASEQISRCAEIGPVLASLRDGEGVLCNRRLHLALMAHQHSCHAVLSCHEATDKAITECKGEDLCRLFTSRAANIMDRVWDWLLDALRSSQPMQLSAVQKPVFECLDASATWLDILRSVELEEDEFGIEGLDQDVRKAARLCLEILLQRGAVGKLVSAIAAVLLNHQDQAEFRRILLVSAATCRSMFRSRIDCKAGAKGSGWQTACLHPLPMLRCILGSQAQQHSLPSNARGLGMQVYNRVSQAMARKSQSFTALHALSIAETLSLVCDKLENFLQPPPARHEEYEKRVGRLGPGARPAMINGLWLPHDPWVVALTSGIDSIIDSLVSGLRLHTIHAKQQQQQQQPPNWGLHGRFMHALSRATQLLLMHQLCWQCYPDADSACASIHISFLRVDMQCLLSMCQQHPWPTSHKRQGDSQQQQQQQHEKPEGVSPWTVAQSEVLLIELHEVAWSMLRLRHRNNLGALTNQSGDVGDLSLGHGYAADLLMFLYRELPASAVQG